VIKLNVSESTVWPTIAEIDSRLHSTSSTYIRTYLRYAVLLAIERSLRQHLGSGTVYHTTWLVLWSV